MDDPRVGATPLGKLRVLCVLGAGGMGIVYEVEHLVTGHRRALKVLHRDLAQDGRAVARLMREASIAGRVASPRLVDTYDVGRLEDGAPYLLMERLEGRTLAERLRAEGPLDLDEAMRITAEIGEGLTAAHAAGVLHRDLTPKNVFLARDGGVEHVRLVDFGLSKMIAGRTDRFGHLTDTGAFVGTPHYVSPEEAAGGPVDVRADQYALAVILYECLGGRPPFDGDSLLEVLARIADGSHAPLVSARPEIGAAFSAVVSRALARRPEDRFPDVPAFLAALEHARRAPRAAHVPLAFARTDPVPVSRTLASSPRAASPAPERGPPDLFRGARAPAGADARAPRSGTVPLARPVPPRPPRLWPWIAAALAALAVLAIAFGATAIVLGVLHARATLAPPPAEPAEPAEPLPEPNPEEERHLHRLYARQAYFECVRASEGMARTPGMLAIAINCAEEGHFYHEADALCRELAARAPVHPRVPRCVAALGRAPAE